MNRIGQLADGSKRGTRVGNEGRKQQDGLEAQRATGRRRRGTTAGADLQGPHGVRFTLGRGLTIPLRTLPVSLLAVKPTFIGDIELRAGSDNPRFELIRNRGMTSLEVNEVVAATRRTMAVTVSDHQLRILRQGMLDLINARGSPHSNLGRILGSTLGTTVAHILHATDFTVEWLLPPEIVVSAGRASIAVYIVRVSSEWTDVIWRTEMFGIPVDLVFTGTLEIKIGIKHGGWRWLASQLAARLGTSQSAALFQVLSAQLEVQGLVNGLLGAASPAIVAVGAPLITLLVTAAWAQVMAASNRAGDRWGLLNMFAAGYIRRVFRPDSPFDWTAGFATPRGRVVRQAGIRAAERDLQQHPPGVLQQLLYVELDYYRQGGADLINLTDRLTQELRAGRRTVRRPGPQP